MLARPEWSRTSPSLDGMIAFIKTKPPTETYRYVDCTECACAQYYKSIGLNFRDEWQNEGYRYSSIASTLNAMVASPRGERDGCTWGAALERAYHYREVMKREAECYAE